MYCHLLTDGHDKTGAFQNVPIKANAISVAAKL
jgi:hypothetical protein